MFFGGMPGGFPGGPFGGGGGSRKPVDNTGFYKELGIEKDATQKQIKKAFRKLAQKYHPDMPNGDEERFKQFQEAYEVLSDPEKRETYDKYGKEGLERGGGGAGPSDLFDLFSGGGRPQQPKGNPKPPVIEKSLRIELEDSYIGSTVPIQVQIRTATGCKICEMCNGRGVVMETVRQGMMIMQSQRDCTRCNGKGKQFSGEKNKSRSVDVIIPKGCRNGDKITLRGEGHQLPEHDTGDIVVDITVADHPVFERIGADLAMEKVINVCDALIGVNMKVKHLSGTTLVIKPEKGETIHPGAIKVIMDWGMPQKGGHRVYGNLNIKFRVLFPLPSTFTTGKEQLKEILKGVKYPDTTTQNSKKKIGPGVRIRLKDLTNLEGEEGLVVAMLEDRLIIKLDNVKDNVAIPVGTSIEFVKGPAQESIYDQNMDGDDEEPIVEEIEGVDIKKDYQHTPIIATDSKYDVDEERQGGAGGVECRAQ